MLVYINVETTGLESNDRICALGLIVFDEVVATYSELIKPPKKVRPEASALHHITNEMLKEKKDFQNSYIQTILQKYNNSDTVFVGHNISFNLEMLKKEGFVFRGTFIDTLKCTRALIQECEQFSLQYLRYELKLYKGEQILAEKLGIELRAHEVLSDTLHVRLLHKYLNEMADDEELQKLSSEPVLLQKLSFGKYKGHFIEEIALSDRAYLLWVLNSVDTLDGDMRYSIEYYTKML
jgi:DNA polymerase-3 subunit epsilon/exodeoxyribonuclease X